MMSNLGCENIEWTFVIINDMITYLNIKVDKVVAEGFVHNPADVHV